MAHRHHKQAILDDVAASFASLEGTDRLEALVEFGRDLPDLSEAVRHLRDRGVGLVRECESPVFVFGEVDGETFRLHVDAPREAPVARGFAGLMVSLFDGRPVAEVGKAPTHILDVLHLAPVLSMRRARGLYGIYGRIRATANARLEGEPGSPRIVG